MRMAKQMATSVSTLLVALIASFTCAGGDDSQITTTLDGPFKPYTKPLDKSFRGNAIDLPPTDPRVQRIVHGFEPEQISVSVSSTYDSVWISWITGLLLLIHFFLFLDSFHFIMLIVLIKWYKSQD